MKIKIEALIKFKKQKHKKANNFGPEMEETKYIRFRSSKILNIKITIYVK